MAGGGGGGKDGKIDVVIKFAPLLFSSSPACFHSGSNASIASARGGESEIENGMGFATTKNTKTWQLW